MARYLILRLDGPMQAWGGHSFEDLRPSHSFPTRSGLLGLLGACLGLDRRDLAAHEALARSVELTVRADAVAERPEVERTKDSEQRPPTEKPGIKVSDFHTVLDARKVDGKANKNPVVSRREYLYDAVFTVTIRTRPDAEFSLDQIAAAVSRPIYTPSLGRRSCPLARPLFWGWVDDADDALIALARVPPAQGSIISEEAALATPRQQRLRDVPLHRRTRQFGTRFVYLHRQGE